MTLQRRAMLATVALALTACSSPTGTAAEAARLERSQRRWEALDLEHYRMTVALQGAWTGGAAVVEVRNGEPESVTPTGDWPSAQPEWFEGYDTVEELFEVVRSALEHDAERLEVEYHPLLGVPMSVSVDVRLQMADDEHGFSVSDFEALE